MKPIRLKIEAIWQSKYHLILCLFLPLSWIFQCIVLIRRAIYTLKPKQKWSVPIVVVGNISVGGNGKTPCVIALAKILLEKGYRPGIVSRGYGVGAIKEALDVLPTTPFQKVGDEPVIIARQTGCPVVVCASRVNAVRYLLAHHDCDLVLSDDGLQHYALHRDIEIVLIGSESTLGNQHCLPAGPLREPLTRLKSVDWVMGDNTLSMVQYPVHIKSCGFFQVKSDRPIPIKDLQNQTIYAYAGIAHPNRFFDLLSEKGLSFKACVYPDHYQFKADDFKKHSSEIIVMTEKDAIKCRDFASNNLYYIKIESQLDGCFISEFIESVKKQKICLET